MDLNTFWFLVWGLLWAVYLALDGFDFGACMAHNFIARTPDERRVVINTIGPVWDGNEVWLVTAGGVTFAAFPPVYASLFSGLYTAMFLLLLSLIFRGVSFEFRGKVEGERWMRFWDFSIAVGGFLPALLLGVLFGNLFRGFPLEGGTIMYGFLDLLNPYALLTAVFFMVIFLHHGLLWLALRAGGPLADRAAAAAGRAWYLVAVLLLAFLAASQAATQLFENYASRPLLYLLPLAAAAGLIRSRAGFSGSPLGAFVGSLVFILALVFTGLAGMYPDLIPALGLRGAGLTAYNSASGAYTLKVMTAVVGIVMPAVIAYQFWVYKVFSPKLTTENLKDLGHYY
ncbi:MAG: cytochrome d ubiquinol oxidase subunit II [Elusimicrobia bacterium]|nr:MAG: cytochrome d ubiquinol oxidase subunit II [Elusimicrobiota bacterium]KAF0155866.1 MAG: cytochrome d ubiquinol oxidase subunit II [Elusimicrobiota bacterium]